MKTKWPTVLGLLLRGLVLFGIIGLVLLVLLWPEGWRTNSLMSAFMLSWLFICGMGLFIITTISAMAGFVTVLSLAWYVINFALAYVWVPGSTNRANEMAFTVGGMLIGLGHNLQSLELSFPLDSR